MKKYIIIGLIILTLGYVVWVSLRVREVELVYVTPRVSQEEVGVVDPLESLPKQVVVQSVPAVTITSTAVDARAHVALITPGHEYQALVADTGEVLYGVMKELARQSDFSFTGKDFSSLGFFVDTINGQKNADGKYWILYVNGVLATEGVSQLLVKSGDRIEWRYEKGK